jgi:pSer/pThr/pTyr-binding forkhead associated (FHA) protein
MELFLQACRCVGPLCLRVEHAGDSVATERVLRQPFALVGCDPRMDLFLNHPEVSRRHVYLQLLGNKVFCVDLQSRTGIHWQEGSKRSGWLAADQALRIGPFSLRATGGGEDPPSEALVSALQSAGEEELPDVALEFVNRLPGPTVWRMETMLALVGRAPLCRVRLVGNSVSKFHCSLVRTPLGLWVVDLFGKEGITVNETPVRSARLEDGDRLQVGNFVIRTRYLQTPPLRIPFSHLANESGLTWEQTGSDLSFPELLESMVSGPAARATQAVAPAPSAERTELAIGSARSLVPQVLPTPCEAAPGNVEAVQSLLVPIAQQLGMVQQQMFDQFQQAMLMLFQMFGKLQREQIGVIRDEMDRLHQLSREVLALQAELVKHPPPAAERPRGTAAVQERRVAPYSAPTNSTPRPAPAPRTITDAKPLPLPQRQPEKDMHAWLSERIAALQQERQSRWQKIVTFLGGLRNSASPYEKP